jgi:hypothetical protein
VNVAITKRRYEQCSDVTGAEIGNISKDDNLLGKGKIMSLLPTQ